MTDAPRENWSHHVDEIVRSKHYTWLGSGLGGAAVDEAMVSMLADIMHICDHERLDWDEILDRSRNLYLREKNEETNKDS